MVSAMVDSMGITVPVALHLDHGTYEGCKACIEAGFASITVSYTHLDVYKRQIPALSFSPAVIFSPAAQVLNRVYHIF